MIVSIASGKGGTGKTTVAVSMALSVGDIQLLLATKLNNFIFIN